MDSRVILSVSKESRWPACEILLFAQDKAQGDKPLPILLVKLHYVAGNDAVY
jgi:hypothetical protein